MAIYPWDCHDCGQRYELEGSFSNVPHMDDCPECGSTEVYRNYKGVQFSVFEEYVDTDLTGEPILISSPSQRDRLFKEHNVTMDKFRYTNTKKKKKKITGQDVVDALKKGLHKKPKEYDSQGLTGKEKLIN